MKGNAITYITLLTFYPVNEPLQYSLGINMYVWACKWLQWGDPFF